MLESAALLPSGEKVPLSDGKYFIVEDVISSKGATAIVYSGRLFDPEETDQTTGIKIAIKAYRPQSDSKRPKRESETLGKLMEFEPAKYKELGRENKKLTPQFYGLGTYKKKTPYILMDLIEGEPLLESINSGKLSTAQKISAICDFLVFQEIIHEQMKSVIQDFKVDNLYWTNDGLRILDVGDIVPASTTQNYYQTPKYDLLRTCILLFKLLTGYGLKYSPNGLEEYVEPKLKNFGMNAETPRRCQSCGQYVETKLKKFGLDWGMQRFFRRSLSWKENQRISTATEMRQVLQEMAKYWALSDDVLYKKALQHIDQAVKLNSKNSHFDQYAQAEKALTILGIVIVRNPNPGEKINQAEKDAQNLFKESNYLVTGKQFLQNGYYDLARKQFDQGMALSDAPTEFRRWSYAAKSGEELGLSASDFKPRFDELESAIDLIERGQFGEAVDLLGRLPDAIRKNSGYQNLLDECQMQTYINEALVSETKHEFSLAKIKYQQAKTYLEKLPEATVIKDIEGIDLESKIKEMEHLDQTIGKAINKFQGVKIDLENCRIEEALEKCQEAVDLAPEDLKIIRELIWVVETLIEKGEFKAATQAAFTGIVGVTPNRILMERYRLARKLEEAQSFLDEFFVDKFIAEVKIIKEQFTTGTDQEQIVNKGINLLVDRAIKMFTMAKIPSLLSPLMPLSEYLDGNRNQRHNEIYESIKKIMGELKLEWSSFIDEAIIRADMFLFSPKKLSQINIEKDQSLSDFRESLNKPQATLADVKYKLNLAQQISEYIGYKEDETLTLLTRVNLQQGMGEPEITRISNEAEQTLNHLLINWNEIKLKIEWFRKQPANLLSPESLNQVETELAEQTLNLIAAAQACLDKNLPNTTSVKQLVEEICAQLDHVGVSVWEMVKRLSEEKIAANADHIKQVETYLINGELDKVTASVEQWKLFDPRDSKMQGFFERIKKALSFKHFVETNQYLKNDQTDFRALETLADFIKMDIPRSIWKTSGVIDYLKRMDAKCREEIPGRINRENQQKYLETIKAWIMVKAILLRASKG